MTVSSDDVFNELKHRFELSEYYLLRILLISPIGSDVGNTAEKALKVINPKYRICKNTYYSDRMNELKYKYCSDEMDFK